jgi:hypothetical protein
MRKGLVAHRQVNDEFDKRDNRGNERPAKNKVQDALRHPTQVEFVNAESA